MSILVVDDQVDEQVLIKTLLTEAGFREILIADSPRQAFDLLGMEGKTYQATGIDLILMDVIMPDMTGIEACRRIKACDPLRDIPIVMVTADTDVQDLQAAFAAGAVDYIKKPLHKVDLLARVRSVLKLKHEMDQRKARERELMQVNQQLESAMTSLDEKHRLLKAEQEKSERLLLNILPKPIADQLKREGGIIADSFDEATVVFADIADFTTLWVGRSAQDLVALLNDVFSMFDRLAEKHGLEKIKTIGDAYMAAGGLPTPRPDHAQAVAEMALDMQAELASYTRAGGTPLQLHIGISSGPVVAGVIGKNKFIYDLWGDTVNMASRMEALAQAGHILVTAETHVRLQHGYRFERQEPVQVKGKGEMVTFRLIGRKAVSRQEGGLEA